MRESRRDHAAGERRDGLGVLLASFPGTSLPPWLVDAVRQGLGGVVLFAENTPDLETTRRLCDELHALEPALLVTVDEEGGDVTRLQAATGSSLAGNAALGVVDDEQHSHDVGRALGVLLHAVGVDLDLAPCLDVASQPWNPVIGTRSLGPEPTLVARHGAALVRGMAAAGVAACGKHFPGHGDTLVDSHLGLPVLDVTEEVLASRELPPFEAALAAGLDAVMTAHVVVPALGPGPASLEPATTAWIARYGSPLVVTDALGMTAVGDDLGHAVVAAVRAGAELLCLDAPQNRDAETMLVSSETALATAVAAQRLDPERLRFAAARTRALGRACAAARDARTRVALDVAAARLATLGAETARRALQVDGDPVRSGPVQLLDLRGGQHLAAGPTSGAFTTALTARLGDRLRVVAEPGDVDPSLPVLVLTRRPHPDEPEGRHLAALRARDLDLVCLHTGVAGTAPTVADRVLCHGTGRACAEAAAAAVCPG